MKRICLLVIAVLLPMLVNAYNAYVDYIYYNLKDNEAEVTYQNNTYFNSYTGTVVIPEAITYSGKTYIVTSIGASAFRGCTGLTSVTIPNSVANIGWYAFRECTGLTSVTIPNSVVNIGGCAFFGCTGLTSVIIPNSVTFIGEYAFQNCSNLVSIKVETGNAIYDSRNSCNAIIKTATNTLIVGCQNTIIPHGVVSIDGYAFYGCSGLTSIIIPIGVTSIGDYAFSRCNGMKSVIIHESVKKIGENAFSNCIRLADIYLVSSEPVDCDAINTFESNSSVRDKYDVYNYAVLHVPMGSKEKYAAAYEWRYFSKIKEDMEINGKVFYTTLSVNQAGEGYVKHYVKADEPYTIFIGSDDGLRINTVMFNGDDVTDKLVNGYYTTPNIKRPSKLSISFEQTIDNVKGFAVEDDLHVYGNDGSLFVSGITNPQRLSVYSLNGTLIETQELEGDTKIKLNEGVFIVNVGERSFKVSM